MSNLSLISLSLSFSLFSAKVVELLCLVPPLINSSLFVPYPGSTGWLRSHRVLHRVTRRILAESLAQFSRRRGATRTEQARMATPRRATVLPPAIIAIKRPHSHTRMRCVTSRDRLGSSRSSSHCGSLSRLTTKTIDGFTYRIERQPILLLPALPVPIGMRKEEAVSAPDAAVEFVLYAMLPWWVLYCVIRCIQSNSSMSREARKSIIFGRPSGRTLWDRAVSSRLDIKNKQTMVQVGDIMHSSMSEPLIRRASWSCKQLHRCLLHGGEYRWYFFIAQLCHNYTLNDKRGL